MKNCPKCQYYLQDGATQCPSCRSSIPAMGSVPVEGAPDRTGKLCFYGDPRGGIVLRVPGWDEFGDRNDAEWSLSCEQGNRLLRELAASLEQNKNAVGISAGEETL